MTRLAKTGFRVELPTVAVAMAVYCGFAAVTWCFHDMPFLVAGALASLLLAWHSSFQHETIHGHPTGSRRINTLLGWLPLALWLPYEAYRESHLRHHRCKGVRLTRPSDDPESHYLPAGALAGTGRAWLAVLAFNRTLLGRLLLGPAISVLRFWTVEARRLCAREKGRLSTWARHAVSVTAVLAWVVGVCHIPPTVYVLGVVYPSIALGQLRSFAEHRSHTDPKLRTNVVESGWAFSLLFLNNNLHVAHHARPSMPWYRLPRAWKKMRAEANLGGTAIRPGYWHIARRYLFRPIITAEYPAV
jgi:fatty acid desaturase